MEAREVYKNKLIQGLYGEYTSRRDLTMAEITKYLEFPECSNVDNLRECFEELATLNLVCTQIETMFGGATQFEAEGSEEKECSGPCKKDDSDK